MEKTRDELVSADQLEKINAGMKQMVQFGDSKNGVLLGVNIAILYNVTIKVLSFENILNAAISGLALLCFAISTLILLWSIFPKLKFTQRVNPLFFGSVAQMDRDSYQQLCSRMTQEELVRHYLEQIHTNSQIAARKFREFKWAVLFAIISYMAFAALLILEV